MKKLAYLLGFALILSACGSGDGTDSDQNKEPLEQAGPEPGGKMSICESVKFQSLHPHTIVDLPTAHIATQVFESLLKYNPEDLSIEPNLAESYTIDEAGTTYKFSLKKGVMFHDDACFEGGKGREVKADDVKKCFELLCTNTPVNVNFAGTFKDKVVGANEYYEASTSDNPMDSIPGIVVIDDYTLEIKLIQPYSSFLYTLAWVPTAVFPVEAHEQYAEHMVVGTGPFTLDKGKVSDEQALLLKNKNYHKKDKDGVALPYLDSLNVLFVESKKEQLKKFEEGNVDLVIGLPAESIKEVVENQISEFQNEPPRYVLDRSPEMGVNYYAFNIKSKAFGNKKVRQAINYAIDKDRIVNDILKGEAYGPGNHGLTPPAFKGYDITKITGYGYDVEKAKKLLSEAGYPNGKGFPTVKLLLNSGGSKNTKVAIEIQEQLLTNLGINLDLEIVSLAQRIEDSKYGRADIYRTSWVADFPSPENFLWLCYGKDVPKTLDKPSYPNMSRYANPAFDKLYEAGVYAQDEKERYAQFLKAEQLMIDDAPVIPLWYEEKYRLTQSHIKNYYSNAMNYRDFAEVYVDKIIKQRRAEYLQKQAAEAQGAAAE